MRLAGAAGVAGMVLIIGGLYLNSQGLSGAPSGDDPTAWSAWAKREELAIEIGVYGLLVPGLLLFLWMFAAFVDVLPPAAIPTRLATYGAITFAVMFAASGVLSSTTASAFGYQDGFDDPTGITVLWGKAAGFNLQYVGIWGLAVTILASAIGLRRSGSLSSGLFYASIGLAILAAAGAEIGIGIIFCAIWMVAVSVVLLRRSGQAVVRQ